MTPADRSYFCRRIQQELAQVARAASPISARIHLDLARRYGRLIDAADLGLDGAEPDPSDDSAPDLVAHTRIGIST